MFTNSVSKIFVVLLLLAIAAVSLSFISSSSPTAKTDRSYDGIEQLRIDRPSAESKEPTLRGYPLREQSLVARLWSGEVFLSGSDTPDLGLNMNVQSACMSEDNLPHRHGGCAE